jgi:hypothetical protein
VRASNRWGPISRVQDKEAVFFSYWKNPTHLKLNPSKGQGQGKAGETRPERLLALHTGKLKAEVAELDAVQPDAIQAQPENPLQKENPDENGVI